MTFCHMHVRLCGVRFGDGVSHGVGDHANWHFAAALLCIIPDATHAQYF